MVNYTMIPVLGIQNAGKTSLIKVIKREFKNLSQLKPTKGIERSKLKFLANEIIIWDFGGQAKYRSNYKKKAAEYFSEVSEMFYILDIQDQNSFTEAINYFKQLVSDLKEYSPDATINLLMHKTDPGMDLSEDLEKLFAAISEKFAEIGLPMQMRITQTSIFNPISVITAFSKPLFGNATLYDNFSNLFKDFVTNSDVDFVIIFSEEMLEIGNYFSPDIDQKMMTKIAVEIFQSLDNKKLKLEKLSLQAEDKKIHITIFKVGDKKFYFVIGFNESVENENASQMVAVSDALLEEVKKFMSYF